MTRLDRYRAQAQRQLTKYADVLYRHEATWSDGTSARFSVQDPTKGKDVRSYALSPDSASLRVVRFHPEDPVPAEGAQTPWETGLLIRAQKSDTSDFTGTASYAGRLLDERTVPQLVSTEQGRLFLAPVLPQLFAQQGQSLTIVRPGSPTGPTGEDGRRTLVGGSSATVHGLLYGLSLQEQTRLTRGDTSLPVPRYVAFLPHDAPVAAAGWHLEANGLAYYPLGDVVDFGNLGVAWEVPLGAPGQRRV